MKTRTSFSEIHRPHVRRSLSVASACVLVVVCVVGTVLPLRANNLSISSVSLASCDVSAGANNAANFVSVLVSVSWDNSWRSRSTGNWDAAWLFVKFRRGTSDPTFTSVSSSSTTVTVSSTAALRVGMPVTVTAGTGAFAANTVITSITNSTQFVVSATPTTPLSGASITCYRIWEHARLHNSGHTTGSIGTAGAISAGLLTPSAAFNATTNPGLGVFLYRSDVGSGTFTSSNVQLRWNYGANGINDADSVDIRVFGTEMVYVPQGSFFVGTGGTEDGSFTNGSWTSGSTVPLQITSEAALGIDNAAGKLWGTSSSGGNTIGNGAADAEATLSASFPKGFAAFYGMKYEITQGQYRDFLNTLTRTQQANRVTMDGVVGRYAGGYTFTSGSWSAGEINNLSAPVNRIGLRLITDPGGESPRTYACDMNSSTSPYTTVNQSDDGEWIAMGQLNWMDGCAFADWSGLRPMTELEFEKACRGPITPVSTEFAWGTTTATSASDIMNSGQVGEVTSTANANSAFDRQTNVQGPMRAGAFAGTATSRAQSGASYFGIMEMSGNVWDRLVNVAETAGRNYTGVHGDGAVSTNGNANTSLWPGISSGEVTGATGSGSRGSSWDTQASNSLQVSARNLAVINIPQRYSATGFRGVRSTSAVADNGLVLHLDAGNTSSYPGTGSTWTDLTGNGNNATLSNFTFNSANGGSIDFNSSTTQAIVAASSTIPYGASARTVSMWIYTVATSWNRDQNNVFFYGTAGSSRLAFGLDMDTPYPQMQFWNYGDVDNTWTTTFQEVGWNNICITYGTDQNIRIYENGVLVQNYFAPNPMNTSANTAISIGSEGALRVFDGRISAVYLYNRALTATEVLQNFNALKGRYGL